MLSHVIENKNTNEPPIEYTLTSTSGKTSDLYLKLKVLANKYLDSRYKKYERQYEYYEQALREYESNKELGISGEYPVAPKEPDPVYQEMYVNFTRKQIKHFILDTHDSEGFEFVMMEVFDEDTGSVEGMNVKINHQEWMEHMSSYFNFLEG